MEILDSSFSNIEINDSEENVKLDNDLASKANLASDVSTSSMSSTKQTAKVDHKIDRPGDSRASTISSFLANEANISNDDKIFKAFSSLIMDQLNIQDVNAVLDTQNHIMNRLDKTNASLVKANQYSSETLRLYAMKDYQSYIAILNTMKSDLEYIFKKIKLIKNKLQTKYPSQYKSAFETIKQSRSKEDEEDEEEEEANVSNTSEASASNTPRKITIINEEYQNELKEAAKLIDGTKDDSSIGNIKLGEAFKQRSTSLNNGANQATTIIANLLLTARDRISSSSKELVNGVLNSPLVNSGNNPTDKACTNLETEVVQQDQQNEN